MSEFEGDLKRTKYLKRLFRRYKITKSLKERLILNHLVIMFNVFGMEAGLNILELKLHEKHWELINPFLVFLNAVPSHKDIEMNQTVVDALRKI